MKNFSLKLLILPALLSISGWMLSTTLAFGSGPTGPGIPAHANTCNCDIDAPDNFHVVNVGADFIAVEWDAVTNAQAYYLEATSSSNGQLVYNTTVAGTSATLLVPAGGTYDVSVAAVAPDCPPSSNRASIPNIITLIVDLIATGKTEPAVMFKKISEPDCADESWTHGSYWFRIFRYGDLFASYEIGRIPSQPAFPDPNCQINDWTTVGRVLVAREHFTQAYIGNTPPCTHGLIISIKTTAMPAEHLYDLDFSGWTSDNFKLCIDKFAGSEYEYSIWEDGTTVIGEGRSASLSSAEAPLVSIRNPFTDELQISIPETSPAPAHFRLFNLNGTSVLDQQFPARQEYNLPTAGLPPGFYLLRMESGGVSRTYKVVKAQ